MPALQNIVARSNDSNSDDSTFTPTMSKLLIALVVLIVFGMLMVGVLFILKARRSRRYYNTAGTEPSSNSASSRFSHHRNLTFLATPFSRNSSTCNVTNEKEILIDKSATQTSFSGLPEIRITFPDEEDSNEKSQSGRVVVVKISDKGGVGLEPVNDGHLPPYQKSGTEYFQSLDLDRIGGLKEIEKSKS